ncbi:MAG TPA: serine O-acetyltransferase [Magnetospirillaceae bacterium]|jgi:serine O-acetyltransferase
MIFKSLRDDIRSIMERDPAARSSLEVLLAYPGLQAVMLHRLANFLWRHGFLLLGRLISNFAIMVTGIEIHPGAKIGARLFIDHGSGVVIGETAEIGNDVTLYQGVTLGGTSLHHGKRHPTLEDGVIVGAGARVLGPFTVGAGARIGANAVVLSEVPKGMTMVGIPARPVMRRAKENVFQPYGLDADLPDPVLRAIDDLRHEVARLNTRIAELEGRPEETDFRASGTN